MPTAKKRRSVIFTHLWQQVSSPTRPQSAEPGIPLTGNQHSSRKTPNAEQDSSNPADRTMRDESWRLEDAGSVYSNNDNNDPDDLPAPERHVLRQPASLYEDIAALNPYVAESTEPRDPRVHLCLPSQSEVSARADREQQMVAQMRQEFQLQLEVTIAEETASLAVLKLQLHLGCTGQE